MWEIILAHLVCPRSGIKGPTPPLGPLLRPLASHTLGSKRLVPGKALSQPPQGGVRRSTPLKHVKKEEISQAFG